VALKGTRLTKFAGTRSMQERYLVLYPSVSDLRYSFETSILVVKEIDLQRHLSAFSDTNLLLTVTSMRVEHNTCVVECK
jgi:hypothetical protein